ncbi:hypothetical protein TSUD_388900 [Trifolium subterraneum]|uniref:Uncharacterized protein n=1 Tax=Trifolium subterraneum TaxID=3900 RepID=A0A2Z6N4K4_TRISU|nr:hypothetical protein TSUD_388900 [Trifolium subterraneum]
MGFHNRKFLTELCELICHGKESLSNCSSNTKDCTTVCFKICLPNPQYPFFNHPPPPSPPQKVPSFIISDENNNHKLTNYFILTLSLVAFVFFLVCIRAICITFRSRRTRRLLAVTRASPSSASSTTTIQQIDENFDENQHFVDHPIWYIRTLGLNQSVINTISVCKYKKGEGFESCDFDSESRNRAAAEEEGERQLGACENERRVVDAVSVSRPRRSVSMDDSFVANINNALANVLSIEESKGNSESSRVICNEDTISKGIPSPMKRSSSYNGKFLLSWYSRNQKKPNAILRS